MPPGPSAAVRHVLAAAVATLFLLASMRAFFSAVYFSNLSSLGITVSAAWAVVLLAPALLLLPGLRAGGSRVAAGLLVAVAALRSTTLFAHGSNLHLPLAGLTVAAVLMLLPALVQRAAADSQGGATAVAVGMAAGVALDLGMLLASGSVDPTVGLRGLGVTLPLALALVTLALWDVRTAIVPKHDERPPTRAGLLLPAMGLGAWLFLQAAVVGNAHHVARWVGGEPVTMGLALAVGVAAGIALVTAPLPSSVRRSATAAVNGAGVAGLLDLALLHSPALPVLLVFAQAALVVDLGIVLSVLGATTFARAAAATTVAGGVALVTLFVDVFAWTFAFVPLGDVWKGSERVLLPVAFLLVVAGATWPSRWFTGSVHVPRVGHPQVAVLVAVPVILASLPLALPVAPVPSADDTSFRVMAFNVHQGFNNDGVLDPGLFVDILRDADADVVALQESDTARLVSGHVDIVAVLAREVGYHAYYGPPASAQSFGVAILSRYPILDAVTFPLTSFSDNRFAAKALLDVGGAHVWVYAVHLGLPAPDRTAQTAEILTDAATPDGHVVLAGDFNSCPNGLCPGFDGDADTVYADLTVTYQDAWVAAGHGRDDPAGHTYDALSPSERIDYVFVTSGFTVTGAEVLATADVRAASDHLPVVADVVLSP